MTLYKSNNDIIQARVMTESLLGVSSKYRYKRCDLDLDVCNRNRIYIKHNTI